MSKQPTNKKFTPWTTSEVEYVRQNFGKLPTKEIAQKLGRKPPMVFSKANELGLYIRGKRRPNVLQAVRGLYQEAGL